MPNLISQKSIKMDKTIEDKCKLLEKEWVQLNYK